MPIRLDDDTVNEVLDVFIQAVANKVLELAHRPGGAGLASLGIRSSSGLSAKPKLDNLVAMEPKRRGRTGA